MMTLSRSELEDAELLLLVDDAGAFRYSCNRDADATGNMLRRISIDVSLEAIASAGDPLDHLAAWHAAAAADVEAGLRTAIQARRAAGASWRDVGAAFGISRQAAWERFRRFDQLGVVDPIEDLVDHAVGSDVAAGR